MNKGDIAIMAILKGLEWTSHKFSVEQSVVRQYVEELDLDNVKMFQ